MKTQIDKLATLLKRGATSMQICREVGTVSPHRRLTDMKERGWVITKQPVHGKNYYRYFGTAPRVWS